MPIATTELELRLLRALKRIASYQSPDTMRRHSERDWGVGYEECLEIAYENLQQDAKTATRGVRVLKPKIHAPAQEE